MTEYRTDYLSPLGSVILTADNIGLTGLWFEGQKQIPIGADHLLDGSGFPSLCDAVHWLDIYFSGKNPDFRLPLHLVGTAFQKEVWEILTTIPYGQTVTYGDVAVQLARQHGIPKMSAQAVGGAVGKNPVSVIVPCHRVVGAHGALTGYAGGIDRKAALLHLEKHHQMTR